MCIVFGTGGQVRVFAGGDDTGMAQNIFHILQTDTGFNQVSGVAVPQTMRGNVFFIPQDAITLRKVACTPPRSSGVVAEKLPFRPPLRLGKSKTGF
jgi:hypothetical protein